MDLYALFNVLRSKNTQKKAEFLFSLHEDAAAVDRKFRGADTGCRRRGAKIYGLVAVAINPRLTAAPSLIFRKTFARQPTNTKVKLLCIILIFQAHSIDVVVSYKLGQARFQ